MIMALGLAVLLFAVTPTVLINFLKGLTGNQLILSAFEGITKILIFVVYLYSISRMRDIKRVFQYHGAEHKSIFTYENDEELTVENAKKYPTLHPRCGTNFLAIVLMVSILLFSFLSWESVLVRVGLKLLLLPLVAGISYEVLKLAGKSESKILKVVSYPGMMMQKITTSEPDEQQLEVALAALKRALADDEDQ
jgi:uncharacterized protein YqhQ